MLGQNCQCTFEGQPIVPRLGGAGTLGGVVSVPPTPQPPTKVANAPGTGDKPPSSQGGQPASSAPICPTKITWLCMDPPVDVGGPAVCHQVDHVCVPGTNGANCPPWIDAAANALECFYRYKPGDDTGGFCRSIACKPEVLKDGLELAGAAEGNFCPPAMCTLEMIKNGSNCADSVGITQTARGRGLDPACNVPPTARMASVHPDVLERQPTPPPPDVAVSSLATPQVDVGIASDKKPPKPQVDVGVGSPGEQKQHEPTPGPLTNLPAPSPEPSPGPGPSHSGQSSTPQININIPPIPGPGPTTHNPPHNPPVTTPATPNPPHNPPTISTQDPWNVPPNKTPPIGDGGARINTVGCSTVAGRRTCTDGAGHSCTTTSNFCDPNAPQPQPPPLPPVAKVQPTPKPLPPVAKVQPTPKPLPQVARVEPTQAQKSAKADPAVSPPPLPPNEAKVHAPPVQPNCSGDGTTFRPDESESVTLHKTIVGGASCIHHYEDRGAMFTHASIATAPSHGKLTQTGDYEFKYQPQPGFRGSDKYAVEICGESDSGSGCSTLTYLVTVK